MRRRDHAQSRVETATDPRDLQDQIRRGQQLDDVTRPARSTTESGLGDVLVKASYIVLAEHAPIPEIAPYVKIMDL